MMDMQMNARGIRQLQCPQHGFHFRYWWPALAVSPGIGPALVTVALGEVLDNLIVLSMNPGAYARLGDHRESLE